jgi:hypothetical protein
MISCIEGFFDLDQARPSEIEMSVRFTSRGNFATLVPARIARPMEFLVGTSVHRCKRAAEKKAASESGSNAASPAASPKP